MPIRLIETNEPSQRVPFKGSVLFVRRLALLECREIEAKRRQEFRKAGAKDDPDQVAEFLQAVEDDKLDSALTGWEQLDGNPPCTRENKLKLPADVLEAVRVIRDAPNVMQVAAEIEEKNSDGPSSTPSA
jgi:hypothetical protein